MILCRRRQLLSFVLCFALLLITAPLDTGAAAIFQSAALSGSDYSGQGLSFTSEELQSLVAPVALYPDPLLAQALIGATFPDQVLAANLWLTQNKTATPGALFQAVNPQPWDPSIKGLTQFPQVLNDMAQNLVWTSQLGEAYHNQQSAVMAAIQLLRAKAKTEENIKTSTQLLVAQPTGDIVTLQPGNPLVVYVPRYNPALIYGTSIKTPNYNPTDPVSGNGLSFGSGVALSAGASSDWGWANWACNWYHGVADYKSYPYYGNHAWHGGYYGGYILYGNHPYHNDANRPFASQSKQNAGAQGSTSVSANATSPTPTPVSFNAWAREGGGWTSWDELRGWEQSDPDPQLTAFSSWSPQGAFGTGGWGDRSASYRGWVIRGGNTGWGNGGRAQGLRW